MNAMRAFLADQYDEDVDVKFKQVELHTQLLDLFIDLPFRVTINPKNINFAHEQRSGLLPRAMSFYFDDASKGAVLGLHPVWMTRS